jgi:hypothetical protein
MEAMIDGFSGPSADLVRGLMEFAKVNVTSSPELRKIMKTVMAEAGNFPELASYHLETVVLRVLGNIERIIRRGIERGEFRPCDTLMTAQSIFAPVFMNSLSRETFGEIPQFDPERLFASHVEFVLRGLAPEKSAA